ncbi:outer membrane lipoprotein-sorting protein [candidate division CSSED10-310 bacterium]|uniref:Outer membrane lipoprotein-sorting protein n=1 Tax=candidate division CSSED10-310 bacterium TaxID=2855610 RepID=A0ABV6YRZ4_UNCC1
MIRRNFTILLLFNAILFLISPESWPVQEEPLTVEQVISWVDKQMTFETRSAVATMRIIENKRERIKKMKIFSRGIEDSFMVFESPKRDKGVKFLKIGGNLWTYFPSTEKVIKISGHLLRQSMMGSDFSYEDMMESKDLLSSYSGQFLADEEFEGELCYVIELVEKVKGTTYPRRKSWICKETLLPVKEELYAKTGKLLKVITFHDVVQYENRRYPKRFIMRDMLKKKSMTEFIIDEVKFHIPVPEGIFNKRNLNRSIQF